MSPLKDTCQQHITELFPHSNYSIYLDSTLSCYYSMQTASDKQQMHTQGDKRIKLNEGFLVLKVPVLKGHSATNLNAVLTAKCHMERLP